MKLPFENYSYCIDTNALVDLWRRVYPVDVFPSLWKNIEGLIESGKLIAPREVLNELEQIDDDLSKWARKHRTMFVPPDQDQLDQVKDILRQYPTLIEANKTIPDADPFVIALGKTEPAVVVTNERIAGLGGRPRIPNVV
ncbi:MAG TPA: DUF4411 domain-containing protein [Bacteroidetes bacterium]|jgi:hypothetical protein|nr:DUF4411 domain-containing protein [Bacteroidota bacterium]